MFKKSFFIFGMLALSLFFSGCGTMMAEFKMRQESYEEAIPLYREYLAEHPDQFRVRSRLGFASLKTGRMDEAIVELEKALDQEPGDPFSVLYLGMAHLNKEEIGKAIQLWQGYRNRNQPRVEAEINRLLTILQVADSQRRAQESLSMEDQLMTVKPDANTLAVCYYDDLSPDKSLGAFQKGLAAMVITDISRIKSLKVVERIRMQALLEEMKLGQTGIVDERTAPRVGRLLGAESIIAGNLTVGSIQVTTTVTSSTRGSAKSVTVSVEKEKFYELSGRIALGVAKAMSIPLSPDEIAAIGVPQTTSYDAFIYYGQALDALDAGDWQKAKDLFEKAVEEDPQFGMARRGRDMCPDEIWLPNISDLGSMSGSDFSEKAEASLEEAGNEQQANDELIEPETGEGESPGESEGAPKIDFREPLKEVVDKPALESPDFPDPPKG